MKTSKKRQKSLLTDEQLDSVFTETVDFFLQEQGVRIKKHSPEQRHSRVYSGDFDQLASFSCFLVAQLGHALFHPEEVFVEGVALRPRRKIGDLKLLPFVPRVRP